MKFASRVPPSSAPIGGSRPRPRSHTLLLLALLLAGCDDSPAELDAGIDSGMDGGRLDASGPDAGLDSGTSDAGLPDAGAGDAGPLGSDAGPDCSTIDCDDGIPCTLDTCADAVCSHEGRDSECPTGAFCDTASGCTGGEPCLADAECPGGPGGCFPTSRCDTATRVCVFPPLDGDADGHAPMVCGGMDCDDGNPDIHPGAPELCDGIDQDCDLVVDAPLAIGACRADQQCIAGSCACSVGEMECSGACVAVMSDPDACGDCTTRCGDNETCMMGICTCPGPFVDCFGSCTDLMTDANACGACGFGCPRDASCVGGACVCPAGQTDCGGFCLPLDTTTNCGACGNRCATGAACVAGACVPDVTWAAIYNRSSTSGSQSTFHRVEFAPSGALVVAGRSDGRYLFEGTTTTAYPSGSIYVGSHDSTGTLAWGESITRSTSGSGPSLYDMTVAGDGAIYLLVGGRGTMNLSTSGSFVLPGFSSQAVAVVKLSPGGAFQWARVPTFGSTVRDLALLAGASDVTMTGWTNAPVSYDGTTLPTTPGEQWGVALALDSAGATRFFTRVPGILHGGGYRGGVIRLVGTFRGTQSFGTTSLTSVGGLYDLYFAALDPASGAFTSAVRVGSSQSESINAVELLDGGDIVVATNTAPLARYTPSGALVWLRGTPAVLTGLSHDSSDRLLAARSSGTEAVVRYRADGTDDFEIEVLRGRPYAVATRGTQVGVAGSFDGDFWFGSFRGGVRFTPGLFAAVMEAP